MGVPTDRPAARERLLAWFERRLNLTEIFSLLSIYGLFYTELDTRKPLRQALREAVARPLPSYARWPRLLGLLAVGLFVVQAVTGALLAFYYQPTTEAAYASVRSIVRDVRFGWFVHQIHRWGAQLLLAVLIVRLLRFFYDRLYRAPRELLWVVAVALLAVGIQLELTGRLLTWNSLSYWSTTRGLEVVFDLPVVGSILAFLIGGHEVGELTLVRFYFLHVAIVPLVFAVLLYLSFATIRRVGLSPEADEMGTAGRGQYVAHLYNVAVLLTLIFAALVTLAVIVPAPFPGQADPFATPVGVRPPWYLLAAYGFQELFPTFVPHWVSGALLLLTLLLFTALPFVEARVPERAQGRRLVFLLGIAIFVLWGACAAYGFWLDMPRGGGG